MKPFDIEKLERKNIFRDQEPDFSAMQQQVLQQVQAPIPLKSRPKVWLYSAAAAVVVLFGLGFLITMPADSSAPQLAQQQPETAAPVRTAAIATVETPEAQALELLEEDLTQVQNTHPTHSSVSHANYTPAKHKEQPQAAPPAVRKTEQQVDQILAGFTRADLADLANNAEQDVYLDLYN